MRRRRDQDRPRPPGAFNANGATVAAEGDTITIDGFTGNVYVGELPLEESVLEKARQGDREAREQPIWRPSSGSWRSPTRGAGSGSARTPTRRTSPRTRASAAPRASACAGPSTCSSGPSGSHAVQQMIFAETDEEEQAAYDALLPLQRGDFVGIFRAMDGLPVTVRLLDPPLHEFLPDLTALSVEVALGRERGEDVTEQRAGAREGPPAPRGQPDARPARRAARDREARPLRDAGAGDRRGGVRGPQTDGGDPKVEIMIPLVATRGELQQMREELEPVAREILEREGRASCPTWNGGR